MPGYNQKHKKLYRRIAGSGGYLRPGLYRRGILKRHYWVAHHNKAYRLKDLTTAHLANIIRTMVARHSEQNIEPLLKEFNKRRKITR